MTASPRARAETIAREIVTAHDIDWETFDGMSELPEWPPPMNDLATAIATAIQSAVEQERERAAKVAALYIINKGELHPDIPFDKLSEDAKRIAHTTCQYVAAHGER